MMSGGVFEGTGGNKDLITPIDGETAETGGGIDACLTDYGFEDCDGFVGSSGKLMADGKFLICSGMETLSK
jgi:hypothetical protein